MDPLSPTAGHTELIGHALSTITSPKNSLKIPKGAGQLSFRSAGALTAFEDIHPDTAVIEHSDDQTLEWSWGENLELRLEIHDLGTWFFLLGPIFTEIFISQSITSSDQFWQKVSALSPKSLQIEWRDLSEDELSKIASLKSLDTLKMSWCTFNGDLQFVRDLPLINLEIWGTRLTSIQHLESLTQLSSLKLCANDITGERLSQIRLSPSLTRLWLWQNPITDDGLKALSECSELQLLELPQTLIEGWGLAPLVQMKELIHLSFAQTPLENIALAFLNPMPRLKYLNIERTRITHSCVKTWLSDRPYRAPEIHHG